MLDPVPYYRWSRWLYLHGVPLLPRVIDRFSQALFHCVLPHTADLGAGLHVGYHGVAIVVHARAVVGRRVFISPSVTIGGRSGKHEVPRIGNDVFIAPGARILGDIEIGDGAVIGANAVVIASVPPRSVAAGVPARIIRENVDVRVLTGWPEPAETSEEIREVGV